MFRFQEKMYLWLLLVPAIIILLFIISEYLKSKNIRKIAELRLIKLLIPDASITRKIWKMIFICLALSSMVVALARPQFGSELQDITTQGVEIIVALDVSNSMMAQDIKPSRLNNAKKFIERIIGKLNNDKLGIIVFAGDAFVQMPITDDVRSARMFLSTINTNIVPVQGTAIGKALELASKSFTNDKDVSKIVILITDGENHEDDAIAISRLLKEKNISVFTVGMGLPGGSPIPQKSGSGFIKDRNGNVVMSILDEKTLIDIANNTDGIYVRATNTVEASNKVTEELSKLKKGEIVKKDYSKYDDKFMYLAFFALILLVTDVLISERKNSKLRKIDLFNRKNN